MNNKRSKVKKHEVVSLRNNAMKHNLLSLIYKEDTNVTRSFPN